MNVESMYERKARIKEKVITQTFCLGCCCHVPINWILGMWNRLDSQFPAIPYIGGYPI
jgi:hypothetical protein